MLLGKGAGIISSGLVGGLAGNIVGRYKFKTKNPKDQFIEKYLNENPLAEKQEAESAYNKLKKRALIKSSLLGAGLGAGVGYVWSPIITKYKFDKGLRDAQRRGEKEIRGREKEIRTEFGNPFWNYDSIEVQDSYQPDGSLKKNVLINKILKEKSKKIKPILDEDELFELELQRLAGKFNNSNKNKGRRNH